MKKLKFLVGGQPFRSTDFEVIQSAAALSVSQLFAGITNAPVIVSGIEWEGVFGSGITEPAEPFSIPAGYIYDLTEVCKVADATFYYDALKSLYLRKVITDSSPREIGGMMLNVISETTYQLIYVTAPAVGDIELSLMKRLHLVNQGDLDLTPDHGVASLNNGFVAVVGTALYAFRNSLKERMIVCSFTATSAAGVLCTLPEYMRPAFSITGNYRAGNSIQPLVIKANGDVEVTGAVTSGTNIIMFRYPVGIAIYY